MVVVRQRWTRARSRQGRGDWIWCACEAWDGTGGPHMLGTSGHRGGWRRRARWRELVLQRQRNWCVGYWVLISRLHHGGR